MTGDRLNVFMPGGRCCPTETAVRGSGLTGVVADFEERKLCECEWEWEDRGDGLVAVLVTMMGEHSGPVSVPIVAAGSVHNSGSRFLLRIHRGRRRWSCDRAVGRRRGVGRGADRKSR
jgi:hypothetical protein